jgi:hypothetical protein
VRDELQLEREAAASNKETILSHAALLGELGRNEGLLRKTIHALEERLQEAEMPRPGATEAEQVIEGLRATNRDLQSRNSELREAMGTSEATFNREREMLKSQNATLTNHALTFDYERKLFQKNARDERRDLEAQRDIYAGQVTEQGTLIQSLREHAASAQSAAEVTARDLRSRIAELESINRSTGDSLVASLTHQLDQKQKEYTDLLANDAQRQRKVDEQLRALRNIFGRDPNLRQTQETVFELRQQVKMQVAELEGLDTSIVQLDLELQELRAENDTLKAQLATSCDDHLLVREHDERKLELAYAERDTLQSQLSASKERISHTESTLADAHRTIEALNVQITNGTAQLEAQQEKNGVLQKENDRLTFEVNMRETSFMSVDSDAGPRPGFEYDLETANEIIRDLKSEVSQLRHEMKEFEVSADVRVEDMGKRYSTMEAEDARQARMVSSWFLHFAFLILASGDGRQYAGQKSRAHYATSKCYAGGHRQCPRRISYICCSTGTGCRGTG